MKFPMRLKMRLGLFALILALIPYFQNCDTSGPTINFDSSGLPPVTRASGGSGDGLDGKPRSGDWLRTFPSYSCPGGGAGVQATMTIDATTGTLVSDNCTNSGFSFGTSDPALAYEFYNPNFFTFSGGIFEIKENLVKAHVNESLCRFKDNSHGVDVVIQSGLAAQLSAKVLSGVYSSREIASVNYIGSVSKIVYPSTTEFKSADGSMILTINGSPQDFKNLSGTLTTHVDGTMKDFSVVCQKMSQEPVLLVDVTSLAAYWKFDTPAISDNSTLVDSAGGFSGTVHTSDAVNKAIPGVFGNAMTFDGANDYVAMGNVLDMAMNDFSVSFWVRTQSDNFARAALGKRWDLGGNGSGWNIMLYTGELDPRMSDGSGPPIIFGHSIALFSPTIYRHLVVAYDRTNRVIRSYVDGVLARADIDISAVGSVTNPHNFYLGAADSVKSGTTFWGDMDEVSVWNRALNAADAQAIYKNVILY
jgi:hypothetical protein